MCFMRKTFLTTLNFDQLPMFSSSVLSEVPGFGNSCRCVFVFCEIVAVLYKAKIVLFRLLLLCLEFLSAQLEHSLNLLCLTVCIQLSNLVIILRHFLVIKLCDKVTGASHPLVLQEAIEYGILAILRQWVFWFFLIGLVFCLTVQLNYLNRALDIFNTSIVTPLLYVFFTAFVLIASTILFKEGSSLSPTDYIGNVVGLVCIVSGIVLLTLFRVSWQSLISANSGVRLFISRLIVITWELICFLRFKWKDDFFAF